MALNNRNTPTHDPKLKQKLVAFVLFAVVLFTTAGYLFYRNERSTVDQAIEAELSTVAVLKAAQLEEWFRDEIQDAENIAKDETLTGLLREWLNTKSEPQRAALRRYLLAHEREHSLDALFIFSPDDRRILATTEASLAFDNVLTEYVDSALNRGSTFPTDIYFCRLSRKLHIDFIAPIPGTPYRSKLVLVCRFDPVKTLFPLLEKWPTPRETAESFLIRPHADSLLIVSKLRFATAAAGTGGFAKSDTANAAVRGVATPGRLVEGLDYRGKEVLAFAYDIKDAPWFIVVEIDASEALSEMYFEIILLIGIEALLFLSLAFGTAYFYSNRQRMIYRDLARTQDELRTILACMADAVVSTDLDGRIRQFNPAAETLTGWSAADAVGKPVDTVCSFLMEGGNHPLGSLQSRALRQSGSFSNGIILVTTGGRRIPIQESLSTLRDSDGNAIGIVALFRDQTELLERQRLLADSEIKYRTLFEATTDGVALHLLQANDDPSRLDAVLIDCNERFANVLATSPERLVGKSIAETSVVDSESLSTVLRQVAATRSPVVSEMYSEAIARHFIVTVYSPTPDRLAVAYHDITDRKMAEEALTAKIVELERFNHITVDRELRMVELKREVNALLAAQGLPERYGGTP